MNCASPTGMLQKPGGTEANDSSSSDSSEDEEAVSQVLCLSRLWDPSYS